MAATSRPTCRSPTRFRDELGSPAWQIGKDGCVRPIDKPGIGVEIDEKFLVAHPVIEGPGYV
jgi:L-alanine-DL-glutamate epimerase-like enolase superfamily enzyme